MKLFGILLTILIHVSAIAAKHPETPISFKSWKDQQVVEAQNKVVRLSNAILILKSDRARLDQINVGPDKQGGFSRARNGEIGLEVVLNDDEGNKNQTKKTDSESAIQKEISEKETQLARAVDDLEMAKALTVEDYLAVYLSQFQSDDASLQRLAETMGKDDVFQILKAVSRQNQNSSGGKGAMLKTGSLFKNKATSM